MQDQRTIFSGRVARRKEETRSEIIRVAMILFMTQGVDATSMEQIAEAADIARGTLYNYFPVKEAIIDEYIKRSFQQKNADRVKEFENLPDTRARLTLGLSQLMDGVMAQKEIFEKYHAYRTRQMISLKQDESIETGISRVSMTIIELGQKSGELRCDLPLDILIDLFDFAFIEVARQFYIDPQHFDVKQAIDEVVDLFINGARSKDSGPRIERKEK